MWLTGSFQCHRKGPILQSGKWEKTVQDGVEGTSDHEHRIRL